MTRTTTDPTEQTAQTIVRATISTIMQSEGPERGWPGRATSAPPADGACAR
ncbi:MAG: hypothetical protein ABJA98_12115 [Acidobacteriota bacterium]